MESHKTSDSVTIRFAPPLPVIWTKWHISCGGPPGVIDAPVSPRPMPSHPAPARGRVVIRDRRRGKVQGLYEFDFTVRPRVLKAFGCLVPISPAILQAP